MPSIVWYSILGLTVIVATAGVGVGAVTGVRVGVAVGSGVLVEGDVLVSAGVLHPVNVPSTSPKASMNKAQHLSNVTPFLQDVLLSTVYHTPAYLTRFPASFAACERSADIWNGSPSGLDRLGDLLYNRKR
jgi:hypothetical protein